MIKNIANLALVLVALVFTASAAAQTQTDTNCTTSPDYGTGRTTNCTSTTTNPTPPNSEWLAKALAANRAKADARRDQMAQQTQLSQEEAKALLAAEKKDTVDFIYCRQNQKGGITNSDGKPRTCADIIEYTKAFCSVNPDVERCTLAKSQAEVKKKFVDLAEQYKNDRRAKKRDCQMFYDSLFVKLTKWGCMSFPDMTLPQRDGTLHSCPNAPENAPLQADTGSQNK